MTFENATQKCIRDHPYITSAKVWDGSRKCSVLRTFSTVFMLTLDLSYQFEPSKITYFRHYVPWTKIPDNMNKFISGGSEKVLNYADVIYGWFLRQKYSVYPVEKFLLYLLEGTKTFLTARFGLLGKSNSSWVVG